MPAPEPSKKRKKKYVAASGRKMPLAQQAIVHASLILICLGFIMPLVWMVSTSLKINEQTQEEHPSFIPYTLFVNVDGKEQTVSIRGSEFDSPQIVVRNAESGAREVLPADSTYDGELIEKVPASEHEPYVQAVPTGVEKQKIVDEDGNVRYRYERTFRDQDWFMCKASGVHKRADARWYNYYNVINHHKMKFPLFTRNTLIIAVLCVFGTVFSSAFTAYGFAKIEFRGRGPLFVIMLATMMVPFPVLMVSLFAIFRWMGEHGLGQWLGTYKPLWVPAFFASPFFVFLLRQFYRTLPIELSEAAKIDGCSELGIFFRVVLPLSKPALAVVALFTFMAVWNDFIGPLIYIQDQEQYTLALGLQSFQSQHEGTPWNELMAASALILAPIIVLFFVAQRTFIEGIATTGMKG